MVNLASDLNMHGLTQAPATGGGTGGSGVIEFNGKRYEPQYAMKLVSRPYPIVSTLSVNYFTDNYFMALISNGNPDTNMGYDIVVYDMNNNVVSRTQSSTNLAFANGLLFASRGGNAGTTNEEYVFIDPENDINIIKKRSEITTSGTTAGMSQAFSFNGKIGVLWGDRKLHVLDNDGQYLGAIDLTQLIPLIPGATLLNNFGIEGNGILVDGDDLYITIRDSQNRTCLLKFDISGVLPSFTQGYYYVTFANIICKGIKREGIFVYVVYSSTTSHAYSVVLRASDLVVASAFAIIKSLPYGYSNTSNNVSYSNGAIFFYNVPRSITPATTTYQLQLAVMLTVSVDSVGTPYVKDFDVNAGYDYLFFGTTPFSQQGTFYFKSTKAVAWSNEGAVLHSLEPTFIGYKEVVI